MSEFWIGMVILAGLFLGIPLLVISLSTLRNIEGVSMYNLFENLLGYIDGSRTVGVLKKDLKPEYTFKRSFTSPSLFFGLLALIFSLVFSSYIFKESSRLTVFLIPVFTIGILLINIFTTPTEVSLTEEGFFVNNHFFKWEDVQNLNFRMAIFGDVFFSSQAIIVHLKNNGGTIKIPARMYARHGILRKQFERFAVKNGIPSQVEDRGV